MKKEHHLFAVVLIVSMFFSTIIDAKELSYVSKSSERDENNTLISKYSLDKINTFTLSNYVYGRSKIVRKSNNKNSFSTERRDGLTGIKYIPGDYATIQAAISDLNTLGVGAGGVTFRVAANKVDTAANLIITATGTASSPIIFEKWGSGANPVIIAGVGTTTNLDGIIKLAGTDYITFDGIDLMENPDNTTTTTQMEFGYALLKADATNGCRFVVIKNCNITLNKTNTATWGIYAANHTPTSTTSLTITDTLGTNSYNRFYNNNISNVNSGIRLAGYSSASYYDKFNYVGVDGRNSITNYGSSSAVAYGIYTIYQDNLKIANDSIVSAGGNTSSVYGINLSTATNANADIYNNVITLNSSGTSGGEYPIYSTMGSSGTNNTINIYNNVIKECSYNGVNSGLFYVYYIYQNANCYNLNMYGNQIINNTYGTATTSATGTLVYLNIYQVNTNAGSTTKVYNNIVANNSRTALASSENGPTTGINTSGVAKTFEIYNNIFINNYWPTGTGPRYLVYAATVNPSIFNCYNNIFKDINSPAAGVATIFGGIYFSLQGLSYAQVYNNSIKNINVTGTQSIYGIYCNTSSTTESFIYGDTLYNIVSDGGSMYGIYIAASDTTYMYKNNIGNLSTTTGSTYGIYTNAGNNNYVYNTFISALKATASESFNAVAGIYFGGTQSTKNYAYYNTIYLDAVSSSATIFGTSGIYSLVTPFTELRNNIIVNNSTPGPLGGAIVAYRRSDTILSTYSTNSNRNCFYSGTPGANRLIFYDGTNFDTTLALYKIRVAPRDTNSVTENPPFMNVTTSPYNLHINTTVATLCESGADTITTTPFPILTDYDNQPRYPNPGYPNNPSYPATNPDIGADEFAGMRPVSALALNLKVYLEGFWNGTTHVEDTIRVYLAGSSSPYQFVDSQKVVISSTGTANISFTNSSGGNYYIAVKHRNHLETWSRLPQAFSPGVPVNYDFTTDSAKAYGYNMKKVGSSWVLYGGDPNQDGSIDTYDILIFVSQFGLQGYLSCDFNGDGDVNTFDVFIIAANYGLTKSVPSLITIMPDPITPKTKTRIEDYIRNLQQQQQQNKEHNINKDKGTDVDMKKKQTGDK